VRSPQFASRPYRIGTTARIPPEITAGGASIRTARAFLVMTARLASAPKRQYVAHPHAWARCLQMILVRHRAHRQACARLLTDEQVHQFMALDEARHVYVALAIAERRLKAAIRLLLQEWR
jgi:hypothetical protein